MRPKAEPTLIDELLDQVLEDDRAAAVQEFRERGEFAIDAVELANLPSLGDTAPDAAI